MPGQGNRGRLEEMENWNLDCLLGFEPAKEIVMILETNLFGAGEVNIFSEAWVYLKITQV